MTPPLELLAGTLKESTHSIRNTLAGMTRAAATRDAGGMYRSIRHGVVEGITRPAATLLPHKIWELYVQPRTGAISGRRHALTSSVALGLAGVALAAFGVTEGSKALLAAGSYLATDSTARTYLAATQGQQIGTGILEAAHWTYGVVKKAIGRQ
jgi:hypothetical protein